VVLLSFLTTVTKRKQEQKMRTSLAQVESGINLLDTHTRQSKASLYFRLGLLFRRLMYDEWKFTVSTEGNSESTNENLKSE